MLPSQPPERVNSIPSKWTIAFSAGTFFAISSFALIQSFFVSGVAFVLTVYTASRDPITEVGIVEGDDISGPMARIGVILFFYEMNVSIRF